MDDLEIIERVLQRLRGEYGADLLGVLAGGSRLRGEGDAHSDLDIVVVIARPQRKWEGLVIDGVGVEMVVAPPFQIRRFFENGRRNGRGLMSNLCATGRTIFDPKGTMARLQAEARSIREAGPPPLSKWERWHFRFEIADILRDIEGVRANDEETAASLIALLLSRLLDQHYRITGRWLPKPKTAMNDLAQWDAAAARLARQACRSTSSISERCAAACALADHVLAPLGGVMPMEWSTDWESLRPAEDTSVVGEAGGKAAARGGQAKT